MPSKNILIISSLGGSLINFREDFIKDLILKDYKVFCAAPDIETVQLQLNEIGAKSISFPLTRTGLNPIADYKTIKALKSIISEHNIDIVFPYTIKPVLYGSLAARLSNTDTVSLITGLGFTFSRVSNKAILLQQITEFLYKRSIKSNKAVIFQNKDDFELFRKKRILSKSQKHKIVNGSGVNLGKYIFRERVKEKANIKFMLMSRLIKEKGVLLYINAAKALKKKYPEAEFHLMGSPNKLGDGIELTELKKLHEEKIIYFHGQQPKVAPILSSCDVFVLPSFYREGVPRSILEALSIGMPIITTDTPGCRETIRQGENGYLIPPKDQSALTGAMEELLANPDRIHPMGISSYALAKEKFEVSIINNDILEVLERL